MGRGWLARLRVGDWGALPIFIGLVALALLFGSLDSNFYTAQNFVNLLLQMAGVTAIAIGVVFVLLIAEIDLSVGFVSGVGAVVMTLLLRPDEANWPWWAAISVALLICAGIGLLHGLIITKARVPSFVVTLAGYLTWSGVVLILTTSGSSSGTIRIQDDVVLKISNGFLPRAGRAGRSSPCWWVVTPRSSSSRFARAAPVASAINRFPSP